jgi:hypothetical protein
MILRRINVLFLCGLLFMCACDDDSGRHIEPATSASGKAVQVYVKGAMIIADKAASGGVGNFSQDTSEVYSFTNTSGEFEFIVPEGYGNYVLLSNGGTVTDSEGNENPAFPMLAPKDARNITPVTTLAVFQPDLKEKIGADYDADLADAAGVPWHIMQIAKAVESVLGVLTDKNRPVIQDIADQLAVAEIIAAAYADPEISLTDDADMLLATENAVLIALTDPAIISPGEASESPEGLTNVISVCVADVLDVIPNSGMVAEETILASAEGAVQTAIDKLTGTMLAFNPTAQVLPFPNDVAWASVPEPRTGLVTLDPSTAPDIATQALYTAVNALELKGLSPNAPIGIPLTTDILIDPYSLQNNIKIVNLNTLLGVLYGALQLGDPLTTSPDVVKTSVITALAGLDPTSLAGIQAVLASEPYAGMIYKSDLKIFQDGNYIKIVPLSPLSAGATYLVYIEDKADDSFDDFVDINGVKVKQPTYYKFLKSDEALTGSTEALEPLRQNYAVIYNYFLKALGLGKEDTLEIFTFTTADKTLSLADFGVIGAAIGANDLSLLANLSEDGLGYDAIAQEYTTFDNAINYQIKGSPAVLPEAFVSFDITTLADETPTTETVPYTILNGENYTGTVVIFQHGLGGQKEHAAALANDLDLPVIAMDLPLHGARAPEGESGAGYLSTNMGSTRLNFYQSLFDMTLLVKSLKNGQFDLDGDGEVYIPDTAAPDPDDIPETLYFAGQSLGAITGSIVSAFNSELDRVVLSVGGANLASLMDGATNAEIAGTLSIERNNTLYFTTLGLMQLLIDPADPAYLANPAFNGKDFQNETIFQTAYMDTVVPNVSNAVLANALGYSDCINVTDFSEIPVAEAGWYQFGASADMADNWVTHGFLLRPGIDYPEAAGYLNQDYVNGAYNAARTQLINFFE